MVVLSQNLKGSFLAHLLDIYNIFKIQPDILNLLLKTHMSQFFHLFWGKNFYFIQNTHKLQRKKICKQKNHKSRKTRSHQQKKMTKVMAIDSAHNQWNMNNINNNFLIHN